MLIIDSFGKNVYIDEELVGYIDDNCIYIKGKKFAEITDDGKIACPIFPGGTTRNEVFFGGILIQSG